jgi:hypothetical protein
VRVIDGHEVSAEESGGSLIMGMTSSATPRFAWPRSVMLAWITKACLPDLLTALSTSLG